MTLPESVYRDLDAQLAPVDAVLRARPRAAVTGRQPVHTVYVPADKFGPSVVSAWGSAALAALDASSALPFPEELRDRVVAKLAREPVEDLRIDFEDGYGDRGDDVEDAAAAAAGAALLSLSPAPPFVGLRIKSLEEGTRRRGVRTLDLFLSAVDGALPPGFVVTVPKVSAPAQVAAMARLCAQLELAHGLPARSLLFEAQVETPLAVLGPDGTATVSRLAAAAQGRLVGLHYGTYDYSAALGVAAAEQSLAHPVADHAKAVMQVAVAGTGVRLSDGSCNILPVGPGIQAAWQLHHRLVLRSLARGFYQGWDLHPAQLPTRFAATYAFFRGGSAPAVERLGAYLERRSSGILDEPATARALAGFLLRGLDCGALDPPEVPFTRPDLEALWAS
ncbi:aldolase [Asanoa ishikariensis]|uniref:Citrate lyase beta subunit n=1 Tax=Asanoa ishikariensis TaxID=137265 RepID=A0A1H3S8C7_9ACTN|nr:aldolase/citrate lyase family protein [Asanoa ishikariensis]GIF70343.1 aldolase [Asanoa ishikariensis]SDZ33858.1 Citrate lyase beta subunit [Asanoa ishikariensis]